MSGQHADNKALIACQSQGGIALKGHWLQFAHVFSVSHHSWVVSVAHSAAHFANISAKSAVYNNRDIEAAIGASTNSGTIRVICLSLIAAVGMVNTEREVKVR